MKGNIGILEWRILEWRITNVKKITNYELRD